MSLFRLPPLTPIERHTLRLVLPATSLNGLMDGLVLILPEIARRSLHADHLDLALLTMLWPIGQLFALYWSDYLSGRNERGRLILTAALLTRIPLGFVALQNSLAAMFPFFALHALTAPLFIAIYHGILQRNLRTELRGRAFGLYVVLYTASLLAAVTLYGVWLDAGAEHCRHLFVLVACTGLIEAILLSRLRLQPLAGGATASASGGHVIWRPWRMMIALYREDRAFFAYEINFFIYGLGFLFMQPFLTLFLVNTCHFTYTQISLAKCTILYSGIIVAAPFTGRLFDTRNPVHFAGVTFWLIALFPLLLLLTYAYPESWRTGGVYLAYLVFSVGWTFMQFVWNLGAMYFAGTREVARYTGAHIAMVGLRGLLSFLMLLVLMDSFTPPAAFLFGLVMWLLAGALMFRLWARNFRMNS